MSGGHYTRPKPAMRARIIALLRANPSGLIRREIATRVGIGDSLARHYLGGMGVDGHIEFGPVTGDHGRWYVPEHRELVRAEVEKLIAELAAARQARQNASRKARRQQKAGVIQCWFEQAPVHRIVPADKCPPMGRIGPASVFQLGGVG